MSLFKVNIIAINPQKPEVRTQPVEVWVDTGSELTWLPQALLERAEIKPVRERTFQTATKEIIKRKIGYAILEAEGFETIDEVVFAIESDMHLLGVRTIEGFDVTVDNIGHRFVAQNTIVA